MAHNNKNLLHAAQRSRHAGNAVYRDESRVTSHEPRAKAVTLIEMLIVVGIIAILASMVIALVTRVDDQGKERNLQSIFLLLETALQEYHEQQGYFPATDDDIMVLPNPIDRSEFLYQQLYLVPVSRKILAKISNTYIQDKLINTNNKPEIYDPWNTVLDYIYVPGDNFPLIISAGADRQFVTPDDNIDNR